MQDNCSVRRPAHTRVRNAHHVRNSALENLCRQTHVADLSHSGITLRATVLQYENAIFVHFEIGLVDALFVVLDILEYHSAAAMLHEMGRSSGRLEHSAIRRQIATQHSDAAMLDERLFQWAN